jgi:dipeptidyl aminopeptidase/acylaminoacyl peptidase
MDNSTQARTADLPPLIPRTVLFGNPARTDPQLSPDGQVLAYLAPDARGVLQVWVRALSQEEDRVLTADRKRGIRSYFWTYTPGLLAYLQDSDGDENFHLYIVDVASKAVRDLTPFPGVQARLVARNPHVPHALLIGLNRRDRRVHDVYRLHVDTGEMVLDTENPGNVQDWTADAALQVRAATATTPDGGHDVLVRDHPGEPWRMLQHWEPDDDGYAVGFSADGDTLYLVSNLDANAQRLLAVDLVSGQETILAEDPRYDVGGVIIHPTKHHVQAVAFYRDRLAWQVLDADIAADFATIADFRSGEFVFSSRDRADRLWLVAYSSDDGPIYYYRYDRATKQADLLFSNRPKLEGLTLAPMRAISYTARDGLAINGYLTTPPGLSAHGLPAVLLVHGGPWGRDTWGFRPWVQWLANRGYAVLQVNFRGSTGYGKKFLNAGNREWGGKMHDDLIDGVEWLVGSGTADRARIAIMGISYGGYATLAGVSFTPDVFVAGVDLMGPSNIATLLKAIPPYWTPMKAAMFRRVGDPETEEAFLASRSPLTHADRITAPLLIGQGANDPRVPQAESDQIVAAVRRAGRPVEYVVYADEGHGLARPENQLHFFARAEAFLARYLGGRSEPAGAITGHSGMER